MEETKNNGWSAIHLAASKGHLDVVKYLLESGAVIERKTDNGSTAFYIGTKATSSYFKLFKRIFLSG